MGCDGGTIPKRDELVRTKKKPEQKDKMADLIAKWKHCAITQETLRTPVMSCELGKLYNKESILEFLLDRNSVEFSQNFKHIRGLKDLKELNLTLNPADSRPEAEKGDAYIDSLASEYICPVVGVEMNGMFRFCFLWSCGCVMSERALKKVKSDTCHKCGKTIVKDELIHLNGTEEDVELMKQRMNQRREAAKLEKKAKKAEKKKATDTTQDCVQGCSTSKMARLTNGTTSTATTSTAATNGTSTNGASKSKLTNGSKIATGSKLETTSSKISKPDDLTHLQKNPKNSTVYKSLFTSSEECKRKPEQHWITYNPLYF